MLLSLEKLIMRSYSLKNSKAETINMCAFWENYKSIDIHSAHNGDSNIITLCI